MQLLNLQNRINELLSIFVAQVKGATAMGRTDINKVAETVLIPLFKEVYGYAELKNLNLVEGSNYPAIDLGDEKSRVAIQVTSTSDSNKVKDTLSGFVKYKLYERFDHLIIYILTEKQKTYSGRGYQDIIQNQFSFNKDTDIRDYRDLLAVISNFQVDQLSRISTCLEESIETSFSNSPLRENVPYMGAEKFFVGREKEIKALDKLLLKQNRQTILAISGMGGVGKTELAVQYAKRYLELLAINSGGVCWVDAREGDVGSQILRFANSHLGLNPPNDWNLPSQLNFCWRNWASGDWLIVIDDVTDVDYNRQIQPYLPPKSKPFKVLLTSRVEIGPPVTNFPIQTLHIEQALELLRLLIGFERINLELEAAQEICEWLGYLPLGLELLGRYLKRDPGLPLQKMIVLLEKQKLKSKAIREVERHSPMTARYGVEAAFNLSWERLSDNAKRLGCVLSLFALADIPWNLVEMIWSSLTDVQGTDDSYLQETLQESRYELILFSFLQIVDTNKYRLHQLIREFFKVRREELDQDNSLKSHFVVMITSLVDDISGVLSYSEILELEPAIPHLEEVAKDKNKDLQIYRSNEVVVAPFIGLGKFYRSQGLYNKAAQWLEQFIPLAEARFGVEHEIVFLGLNHLITTYFLQGRYNEAEIFSRRFLDSSTARDRHSVAAILGILAGIYQGQGRYKEAESLFEESLNIQKDLTGETSLPVATILNNIANFYEMQGRLAEAEVLCRKALDIQRSLLGDQDIDISTTLNNLANICESRKRFDEAESLYKESLSLREALLGKNHPYTAQTLNNMGYLYKSKFEYEKAEPLLLEALELRERIFGDNHLDVSESLSNLSHLYIQTNQLAKAVSCIERSLKIREEILGIKHHKTVECRLIVETLRKMAGSKSLSSFNLRTRANKSSKPSKGFGKKDAENHE